MELRNFLYLNEKMLDDYLSSIEGYVSSHFIKTEKESIINKGEAGANIKVLKGTLNTESNSEVETRMEANISPSAKVQKLIDLLENVKFYENVTDDDWNDIKRNEIIEVMGTIRFTKLNEFANAVIELEKLAKLVEDVTATNLLDKNTKSSLQGLKQFNELQNGNEVPCILSFPDSEQYQFVCYLDKDCFEVGQNNFVGDVTLLCKIQKKVEKGKSIELNDIFKTFKNLPLTNNQKKSMPSKKELKTPKEVLDVIKGPAFVAIPIAIYK